MTFLLILKRWLSFGLFRRLPSERSFSKAEIRSQKLQFNYNFPFDAMKQAFQMPTKCRASFSRPFSDYYYVLFTKLLSMLRNGLSRQLPIRGTIFFFFFIPRIFYITPFFENRIVQSSGTSQKVLL